MVINCPNCDARVEIPAGEQSSRCEYCATPLSAPAPPRGGSPIGDAMERVFEDRDADGVPDLFQAISAGGKGQSVRHVSVQHSSRYVINGKEYGSLEEMPPDVRRVFDSTQGIFAGAAPRAGSIASLDAPQGPRPAGAPNRRALTIMVVAAVVVMAAIGAVAALLAQ